MTRVVEATTKGAVPVEMVEVICPVAEIVVNAPVPGVVPPIGPGEGNETVDPPKATEVPAIVIDELLRSALLTLAQVGAAMADID